MEPFAHLVLTRHLEPLLEASGPGGEDLRQAMGAGAVAPDTGYYPGADLTLAQAAHQARPWAFGRALWEMAAG